MLPVVLIVAFVVRLIWLDLPHRSLIFDEAYYVNAARVLLGWPVAEGAHYAGSPVGLDPNTEHPPLGKLLMAASMLLFGDNGFGWRVPSLIAGMIALVATWAIARTSGATARLSLLVVTLLAFDNLTFVHGRIGTLDMMVLAADPRRLVAGAPQTLGPRGPGDGGRHPRQADGHLRRRCGPAPVPAARGSSVVAGPADPAR